MTESFTHNPAKDVEAPAPTAYQVAHGGLQTRGSYLPVPLAAVRMSSERPFDLFGRETTGDGQFRYILFRSGRIPLPDSVLDRLQNNGVEYLYIQSDQHREYLRYLEQNLGAAIDSSDLVSLQKAEILYSTAVRLLEEIFERPGDLGTLRRTVPLVSHMVKFVLNDQDAFASLASLSRHDHYTTTHVINVTGFMCALAVAGGIGDPHELHRIGLGGLLHDLGKICISPELLNKTGKLTDEEWEILQSHPEKSLSLASSILPLHEDSKSIIGDHHEKLDGNGYPRKLKRNEIHTFARICAICDVFDALTSKRPYRESLSASNALEMMSENVGSHFDSKWFKTWCHLVNGNLDARNWPPEFLNETRSAEFSPAASTSVEDLTPEDRRQWTRHDWKVPIRIREWIADAEESEEENIRRVDAENLSRDGMLFRSAEEFPPGTRLRVIPPSDTGINREIPGQVVRSIPLGRNHREFLTGLSFQIDEPEEATTS